MSFTTKQEILEILQMDINEFMSSIAPMAEEEYRKQDGRIQVRSMLGYSNRCKNRCLYCGMRAPNKDMNRYWTPVEDIIDYARTAHKRGFTRIFLVSGEDRKYKLDDFVHYISEIHNMGMYISIAAGAFSKSEYQAMKDAGLDEYMMKFEMAQPEIFNKLNPSTTFAERMQAIEDIKAVGLKLASGNIVDYPGQTLEHLAEDIKLTIDLGVSWVPAVPFMPAKNAPLSAEGGPGNVDLSYKEIAILRMSVPGIDLTAQLPGHDLTKGLTDPVSNVAAIKAGANVLFCEFTDPEKAKDFGVIDNRNISGTEHIYAVSELTGMEISF